jgi:DNA-binding XRE family transcriptional regulator
VRTDMDTKQAILDLGGDARKIALAFKEMRECLGLTAKYVATIAGCSPTSYSAWEVSNFPPKVIPRLVEYYEQNIPGLAFVWPEPEIQRGPITWETLPEELRHALSEAYGSTSGSQEFKVTIPRKSIPVQSHPVPDRWSGCYLMVTTEPNIASNLVEVVRDSAPGLPIIALPDQFVTPYVPRGQSELYDELAAVEFVWLGAPTESPLYELLGVTGPIAELHARVWKNEPLVRFRQLDGATMTGVASYPIVPINEFRRHVDAIVARAPREALPVLSAKPTREERAVQRELICEHGFAFLMHLDLHGYEDRVRLLNPAVRP